MAYTIVCTSEYNRASVEKNVLKLSKPQKFTLSKFQTVKLKKKEITSGSRKNTVKIINAGSINHLLYIFLTIPSLPVKT